MLEMSQVFECKPLHGQGRSIRAIAKEPRISRNTVRGYVRGERLPGEYSQVASHASLVSEQLAPRVQRC